MYCAVVTPWLSENDQNDMLVAIEYPAEWSDITAQSDLEIGADKLDMFVALGNNVTPAQIAAIEADSRFAVIWSADTNTPPASVDVNAVQAAIAVVLSSDVARYAVETDPAPAAIANSVITSTTRPPWQTGIAVEIGEVYYYSGNTYEVIQAHTTQADWTPDIAFALFKRFYEPSDDPWPWTQPQGAHDAYPIGARVLHNTYTYVSMIAANVWEPGAVGSESLWSCENCPVVDEWGYPIAYTGDNTAGAGNGDVVTYQGAEYRCLQSHTSQVNWYPSAVGIINVLWVAV